MSEEKIIELRKKIDAIDEGIVSLLDERAGIAREIGALKKAQGKPIVDKEREKNILERVKNASKKNVSREGIEKIFKKIIQATTDAERE